MTIALFPGTFDPFTFGHLDIVRQSLNFMDQIIVGVATNGQKQTLLPVANRMRLISQLLEEKGYSSRVQVKQIQGLVYEYARENQVNVIIKGLRNDNDFGYEYPQAAINRQLGAISTVFLSPDLPYVHLSSTLVRDIARYGGDLSLMVDERTEAAVIAAAG